MWSIMSRRIQALKLKIKLLNERGAALVITLMVMLVLILLSLSLILQSNTEFLISQNEEDSLKALADSEGILEHSNRKIRNYLLLNRPDDLDEILDGVLNSGSQNNVIGFNSIFIPASCPDPTDEATCNNQRDLISGNEQNTSVLYVEDGTQWEIFRLAPGDNWSSNVRTVVWARFVDNYDPTFSDTDDTDFRARLEVRTQYPVWVDSGGNEIDVSYLKPGPKRPAAVREIVGRFAPAGQTAIRTDGDLEFHGSLAVCGECGSAHANGSMDWGNPGDTLSACGNITAAGSFTEEAPGTILGDKGLASEIYIPIVNPYDKAYVPPPTIFTGSGSQPAWLQCPAPTSADPGSSKYFAVMKVSSTRTQVYKAYRNYADTGVSPSPDPNTRWVWRLIGDSSLGNLDTIRLDDCGRLVQCGTGLTCTADANTVSTTYAPTQNNTFYGFNPDNNFSESSCTDGSIPTSPAPYANPYDGGSPVNDWHNNNFPQLAAADTTSIISTGGNNHTTVCATLPGGCPSGMGILPYIPDGVTNDGDGNPDFDTSDFINNGEITFAGTNIYSPLYNAVVFIRGNFSLSGNASKLNYTGGNINIDNEPGMDLDAVWRVTLIVTGSIDPGGGVNFAPPSDNTSYQYLIVAGRDLKLHGSANDFACNGTDCDGDPSGTIWGYSGVILIHEQLLVEGSVGHNGIIISEDRAHCRSQNPVPHDANEIHGSLQIHYDCLNPIDHWANANARIREWEEVQRE